jgi:hypothetical protein
MFLNKKTALEELEKEAEQMFLNYDGGDGYDDSYDEEFDDYDEDYDDELYDYDEDYDDEYAGVPMGKLGVSDRTLAIVVENTNATPTAVNLFGAFKNLSVAGFGIPAGVNVTVPDSSYAQVLNEIASAPMHIKGIKMIVTNAIQFNYTLQFVKKEATGSEERDPLQPARYLSALQNQGTIVEMPGIRFPLDGKVELQSTFHNGVTTQFIFSVVSKVDLARVAQGKSVIRTTTARRRRPRRKK